MRSYQGLMILPPEATVEVRKNQLKALDTLVEKLKGRILQKIELGRKPLGYPVKKFKEGWAMVVDFELDPGEQDSLRRGLELHEDVLKYMITRKDVKADKLASHAAKERTPKRNPQGQDQKVPVS